MIVAALFLFLLAVPIKSQQGGLRRRSLARSGPESVFFSMTAWLGRGDKGFLSRTEDGGRSWVKQVVKTERL